MIDNDFKEKVALVTGGAQGIGEAIVRGLADKMVKVAVVDRNENRLYQLVEELKMKGHDVTAFSADVSDSKAINQIVHTIEQTIGPIDMLVNVAGVLRLGPIVSFNDQDWEDTFSINTTGVFNVSQAVSKQMISRKAGSIVTVGSNSASMPRISMAAYAASKAATTMFMKCLGLELAPYNIRCNIVSPGSTETEMQVSMWKSDNDAEAILKGDLEKFRVGIPLQKMAKPSDIAKAVLFLLSDQASHITMNNLCVDGGATLGV